jgi:hypothetical protein
MAAFFRHMVAQQCIKCGKKTPNLKLLLLNKPVHAAMLHIHR